LQRPNAYSCRQQQRIASSSLGTIPSCTPTKEAEAASTDYFAHFQYPCTALLLVTHSITQAQKIKQ
jgi:hypothetical protein